MSKPNAGKLINLAFSQTGDTPSTLPGNSRQIYGICNHSRDFNINLNKTYDLSKSDENMTASGEIKTILKPSSKFILDRTQQKKCIPRKLSDSFDLLESDESLGILPELLNDEMTSDDDFKTGLDSSDEILDVINPEINENLPSLIYSQSENQLNKMNLFFENMGTPLPNFMVDRRCSSTPKTLAASLTVNVTDNKNNSTIDFLSEKEEPIAGSSFVKFQPDFNLIDFNDSIPLTSTYKEFSLPQLPLTLNEYEDAGVKSKVNFQQIPKTILSNLIVSQSTSNVEDSFSCDSIQNRNNLNDTFQIKRSVLNESIRAVQLGHSIPSAQNISQPRSNKYLEKRKIKTLDSTFEIRNDKIVCDANCEKTFVVDYDSMSNSKDGTLNDTHVLEMNSIEDFSKQKLLIENTALTKELENDSPISFENQSYNSFDLAFKRLKRILEETFTVSELNDMKVHNKNVVRRSDGNNESPAFPEIFSIKKNVTFSENDEGILPDMKVTENDNYPTEFALPNSPNTLASTTFNEELGGQIGFFREDLVENGPINKSSHSNILQSINVASFTEKIDKRADQKIDEFYEKNLMENENLGDVTSSSLSKAVKSFTISDEFEEVGFHERSVFLDSNDLVKQDAVSLQPELSGNTSNSLDLKQSDFCHAGTNFPKPTTCGISTANTIEETEFCSHSIPKEDCSLDMLTKSPVVCVFSNFSEKDNQAQSDKNVVSTETDQIQTSRNSCKEMSNSTFTEKTGAVQIEQNSLLIKKDKFQASLKSPNIINSVFSKLADHDTEVQHERDLHDRNSVSKIASTDLTRKSKTAVKSGLMKPTRIVHPIKVSVQRDAQLHLAKTLCKPDVGKKPDSSVFNITLDLCNNSEDKVSSEGFNRRFTLSCSSVSDTNKSECKSGFKKPLEIPTELGINRPGSNLQKSRVDVKCSNGHLRNISTINEKQNLLTQPNLISEKDPKMNKSIGIASVYKKMSISSRLSLPEKFPRKSPKLKECGLKTETSTPEKNTIKVISEIGIKNVNPGGKKSSIAINLPRRFPSTTCVLKPSVSAQKSAPASISYQPDSIKASNSKMLPKSTAQLKFSSLPKVQSRVKVPLGQSERKGVVDRSLALGNQNSKSFLKKPIVSNGEAGQFERTEKRAGFEKQADSTKGNSRSNSSMVPPSSRQAVQPPNAQICRRIPGKLPQFKRNPAPHCNK